MTSLLSIADLTIDVRTSGGAVRVVDGVSLDIGAGEVVGLAGESGSGKSMTALSVMRLIARRDAEVAGEVRFDGVDLLRLAEADMRRVRGNRIGMVFQEPMNSLHPSICVGDQVGEVLRIHRGVRRAPARRAALELLGMVGIPDPARRIHDFPFQMSGGMQQRVMLAIALACRPALLIADEPTTALDVTVQAQVLDVLRDLQRELGMAVLLISHDLGLLAEACSRIAVMYAGQIVENDSTTRLLSEPSHPYTRALLRTMPSESPRGALLPTIPGAPPRPGRFPNGCRFHPRCDVALASCSEHAPPLVTDHDRLVRCVHASPSAQVRVP